MMLVVPRDEFDVQSVVVFRIWKGPVAGNSDHRQMESTRSQGNQRILKQLTFIDAGARCPQQAMKAIVQDRLRNLFRRPGSPLPEVREAGSTVLKEYHESE